MSVSEEAAAAFLLLHNRLKSLEETVQGSEGSGTRGMLTRMALIKQLVNTSGALGEGRETQKLRARRVAVVSPFLVVNMRTTKTGSTKSESS